MSWNDYIQRNAQDGQGKREEEGEAAENRVQ